MKAAGTKKIKLEEQVNQISNVKCELEITSSEQRRFLTIIHKIRFARD
jgi:hypothetical protein